MAVWNNVVSGFNREEETVNFGRRIIAENNGSLYETFTVATIQSDEEVTGKPEISGFMQYTKVCIAIDKSIIIFANKTCKDILLNIDFDSLITSYCMLEDESFLFVALRNGLLYCLHLSQKGKVVFKKNVTGQKDIIVKIFLQKDSAELLNINLIAETGAIYRITKFNIKYVTYNNDNEEDIEYIQLFRGFSYDKVICAAVGTIDEEISVAMVCSNMLFMWPQECYEDFACLPYKYTKVHFLSNCTAMLCLRTDYTLNMVCPQTLLGLKINDTPVLNFTVIESLDDNVCQIFMLTISEDNSNGYVLRVVSFPELERKFEINAPLSTYLVEVINSSDEIILYLEGVIDSKNNTANIDTIRVKAISECIPDLQLQRLVTRGEFNEAENFAMKFQLSIEPIYRAKAALILSQFQPWTEKDSNSVQLNTLIDILDKIQNIQYIIECCIKVFTSDYNEMRNAHLYARKRIIESTQKMEHSQHLNLLNLINNALHKLETFHLIWGCQSHLDYSDSNTSNEWIRFSQTNFLDEHKMHLSLGEMEAATLIWTRHHKDMIKLISIKDVKEIFAMVPETISSSLLWLWLSHFIPTLLSLIPETISEIILWSYRKLKSLEQTHCDEWPQVGIDFANRFFTLLKLEENHESLYLYQEYTSQNSILRQFVQLNQALSDIQKLKINYRLRVPLHNCLREPVEVAHMLLDKIHIKIIPEFANTFLNQYMLNNSLQNDHVYCSYIQKTIKHSKSWWAGEEAPWEKRVITIISLIQNLENKLQQSLEVLRKAKVPWSSTMVTLAETSSSFDHVIASEIRMEHNCVPTKLILKKYGYECIGINDKLISRIIRVNDDDMISDIHHLTKIDSSLKEEAFSSCTNYYLCRGDLKKATGILQSLENEVFLYCSIQIVNYIKASLTFKNMPKYIEHFIEMLGWVKFNLESLSTKYKFWSRRCNNIITDIDEVKSLYFLRNDFGINITSTEYYTEKNQVLENFIKELSNDLQGKNEELYLIYKKSMRVADLLKLQNLSITSLLLKYTKNITILKYFTGCNAKNLTLTDEECQYIDEMCRLTLQCVEVDGDIAATVENLSAAALCVCRENDIQSILRSNVWARLYRKFLNKDCLNSATTKCNETSRPTCRLYTIYKDLGVSKNEVLLPLFQKAVSIQGFYINNKNDVKERNIKDVITIYNQKEINKLVTDFLDEMKKLEAEHNDCCILEFIKTLYFSFCCMEDVNESLLFETKSVFLQFLTTLLKKLVSVRTIDLQHGLCCLFMFTESDALKWISANCKLFQKDFPRHLTISKLGYEYVRLTRHNSLLQIYKNYNVLHSWAQKLSKYSISYKDTMTSSAAYKQEILKQIMIFNNDNILPLLQDFCYSFGFDIHDCLLLYLETLVKTWDPKMNITSYDGKKELHIPEDEINNLRAKCCDVATKIHDKNALRSHINKMLPQINFYHYEVFIILMDIIEDNNIRHRNYLCFLQNYVRSGEPTPLERDTWLHLHPKYTSLPAIAEWRLPFLPQIKLWDLIIPELNIKTYRQWLDIAPILKVQPHIISTLGIKGEVTRTWKNFNSKNRADKWALCIRNSSLLNDIKKCIDSMTGPDALYYGTAALYYVVNHTPRGADQVAAIQECYKYAQLSAEKSTMFEEGMLEKIKFKYSRFTSEHILRTHGLDDNKYLSLIGNPHKLVHELYTDESIPRRYRCVIDRRPEINSAVGALCELFSINLMKLRLELLQEWLHPHYRCMNINESMTDTFSLPTNVEQNVKDDDNLLRACYILEHGDFELSANFLINIAFGESNKDYVPHEVRYRALCVLQSIVDTTTLNNLTKRNSDTIRQYMKSLKYISKLESLGLHYNVNTFEMCSKYELVQMLLKTGSYSPQIFIVIAEICIDFEIHEYSLWDKTLTQLAKSSLTNDLKQILLKVQNINIIINCNGYLLGWQAIIAEPFEKMDVHPSRKQIDNCTEAIRLLHSCNVVHMLRLTDIISYCFQCDVPYLAAALVPFLNDVDRMQVLKTLKNNCDVTKLLEDLQHLSNTGTLPVSHCSKIIQNAFEMG